MTDHPITPPPELREQWRMEAPPYRDGYTSREHWLMNRSAQWGYEQRGKATEAELQEARDQELEACCEWMDYNCPSVGAHHLRADRRPKPQTLASIALQMLGTIERDQHYLPEITDTIRRALEALPDGQA